MRANPNCGKCGELKTLVRPGRPHKACWPCRKKIANAWYRRNWAERRAIVNARVREQRAQTPGWHRPYHLMAKYGLTVEMLQQMVDSQGGLCAICGAPFGVNTKLGKKAGPYVDHCHRTGRIRGLLCLNCNSGLGQFQDSEERIRAALEYLRRSRQ